MLEGFSFKMRIEDLNKRWIMYSMPQETLNIVEQRKELLLKERQRFLEQTLGQQAEFRKNMDTLERQIHSFHQHTSLENHEKIAKMAEEVSATLAKYQEEARRFNSREMMFELEQTD